MKRALLFAAAIMTCTSCGGQKTKKTTGPETPAGTGSTAGPAKTVIYRTPQPPAMISDPEEQMRWAAEHYWDNFNFADTLSVARWSDYAEQAFVDMNYQMTMSNVPREIAAGIVGVLFRRASANKAVFMKFAEIAEKYLFDPNYPYRNEELYIVVLQAMQANPALDEWERIRPQEQLRLALKNRVGDRAADFRYTLGSGATGTLHGLRATYTLLFFNNPGCPACRETMDQITGSPFLANLIDRGTMQVLAVYPDADLTAWREYLTSMPAGWIVSHDATQRIKNEELYDLKAIPTMYLLDAGKRVMLKDEMSIQRIEQAIYDDQNN